MFEDMLHLPSGSSWELINATYLEQLFGGSKSLWFWSHI